MSFFLNNMSESNKRAFTLIEVLLAILLIVIGILGAYSLLRQTLAFTTLPSDRLVAVHLGQEGIEIVRNIADTNWLEEQSWSAGLTSCGAGCEVDYTMEQGLDSWVGDGRYLYIEGTSGLYKYISSPQEGDSQSQYKRKVIITPGSDVLEVAVEVSWQERGRSHQITVQGELYNWKK